MWTCGRHWESCLGAQWAMDPSNSIEATWRKHTRTHTKRVTNTNTKRQKSRCVFAYVCVCGCVLTRFRHCLSSKVFSRLGMTIVTPCTDSWRMITLADSCESNTSWNSTHISHVTHTHTERESRYNTVRTTTNNKQNKAKQNKTKQNKKEANTST